MSKNTMTHCMTSQRQKHEFGTGFGMVIVALLAIYLS